MATKKFCDRCSEEISPFSENYSVIYPDEICESTYVKDLCESCYEKLQKFIKGGELK